MKNRLIVQLLAILLLLSIGNIAIASIIKGDFYSRTTGWGHSEYWGSTGVDIASGPELTNADIIIYDGWFRQHAQADMDFNSDNYTLKIIPITIGGIEKFEVWIDNIEFSITGEVITGVTINEIGMIPGTPIISWTDNSLHITYEPPSYFNFDMSKIDEFQIVTSGSSPVPEPATMVLFGFGLLGLAGTSRRKTA
ncbi:MAG: PEP-CTERM sorting domain-containing protein [Desulfobacula sp.]|nr:PEP-CTERM sorting domain-containing protein [Desulfobacula sp.]